MTSLQLANCSMLVPRWRGMLGRRLWSVAVVARQADRTSYCLFTTFVYAGSTCIFVSRSRIPDYKLISTLCFWLHFVAKRCILHLVSKELNRKLLARNTTVQLLTLYTDPQNHNTQRHRQTDGQTDRQTDGRHYDANSRSYCCVYQSR